MSGEADRPFYSPVQSLMRSLLATLVDIDFAYEHERAKLSQSRTQASLKVCLLAQLERRHREQREPYVRQLALLQDQHSGAYAGEGASQPSLPRQQQSGRGSLHGHV